MSRVTETTVDRYVQRGAAVEAMRYLGEFPLSFLRPDEAVRKGEYGTEIVKDTGPVTILPIGWYLIRWPDGSLQVTDAPTFAEDFEEARS